MLETEANWDSRRTNKRGTSLVGVGLVVPVKYIFILPWAAPVGPVQNIFFLTVNYFSSFVFSPSNLGRQSCRVACLLVYVSGDDHPPLLGAANAGRIHLKK